MAKKNYIEYIRDANKEIDSLCKEAWNRKMDMLNKKFGSNDWTVC